MLHRVLTFSLLVAAMSAQALAADTSSKPAQLTATEVADRNAAARGGLQNWHTVQTLRMTGKMEAGGDRRPTLAMPGRKDKDAVPPPRAAEQVRLPFVMELKRPKKMRVEVVFAGQNAVQVFDGTNGWKVRPFLNRREVEPYTADELKLSASQSELDGQLLDYAAKGTAVQLVGVEKVEGHDTYKLKLSMKNGVTKNIWIDATSFLELKLEGDPRRLDGRARPVEIYFRDYRTVNGLLIPFVVETRVLGANTTLTPGATVATEQMILDKVEVNPPLSDALFTQADLAAAVAAQPLPKRIAQEAAH